ncbi:MAG: hypothetical protein CL851_00670 [Crocinitomicaceae bacterium]|nr:hypothetical protein [Crocinitomicaceae bacterium]|tara:strand:+ start:484 stop:678 length:195 start_codon:yes stop_codon:yes gene_type:complete
MNGLKKWNKRLEKFWLITAIISTLAAFIFSIIDQFKGDLVYYLLALISWGIFLVRRGLSKKLNN